MAKQMKKFRKKPVEIEAVKFNGGSDPSVSDGPEIVAWIIDNGGTAVWLDAQSGISDGENDTEVVSFRPEQIRISTLEGTMTAMIGDFVIRGVEGEFYPCKPAIFLQTYEVV